MKLSWTPHHACMSKLFFTATWSRDLMNSCITNDITLLCVKEIIITCSQMLGDIFGAIMLSIN